MRHYLFSRAIRRCAKYLTFFLLRTDWGLNGTRQSDQFTQSYNMFIVSRSLCIIALIAIQVTCTNFAHSYEQGSYFVFDILESAEAEPTKGRLAIPAETLAKAETERATIEETERSEFEIDFKLTVQSETIDSAFQSDPSPKTESFFGTTSFQVKAFDFGSSDSVFGE